MVWFLRGICKQCISRLYVYTIFKLSKPRQEHSQYRSHVCISAISPYVTSCIQLFRIQLIASLSM